MFLLVPAYPGCPGSKAVKWSSLLLYVSIFYRFRDIDGYLPKVADFDPPPRAFGALEFQSNFAEIFGVSKLDSLGYRVVLFV